MLFLTPPRPGQMESLSLQLEHFQRENRELRASLSPASSQQELAASQPMAARTPESRWSFLRLLRSARRTPHSSDAKNAHVQHVQHHASRSPARGDGGGALSFARALPPLAGGEVSTRSSVPAGDERLSGSASARSELSPRYGHSAAKDSPQFGPSLAI